MKSNHKNTFFSLKGLLLAGLGAIALSASANAGTVRVTVAEYQRQDRSLFRQVARNSKRPIRESRQVRSRAVGQPAAEAEYRHFRQYQCRLSIIGTRWLMDFVQQGVAEPLDSYIKPDSRAASSRHSCRPPYGRADLGLPIAASARHVLQQGPVLEGGPLRAPRPGPNWRITPRRSLRKATASRRLRSSREGSRDRRLFLLRHVVLGGDIVKDGKSGLHFESPIDAASLYKRLMIRAPRSRA